MYGFHHCCGSGSESRPFWSDPDAWGPIRRILALINYPISIFGVCKSLKYLKGTLSLKKCIRRAYCGMDALGPKYERLLYFKFFNCPFKNYKFLKFHSIEVKMHSPGECPRPRLNSYAVRASFFRVCTLKKFDCGQERGLIRCVGPGPHINLRFHCGLFTKEPAAEDIVMSHGPTTSSRGPAASL
jgi:hypothetical protein